MTSPTLKLPADAVDFPVLWIADILDRTTVVITGYKVETISDGETLYIVAVGREIRGVGKPLIIPKAQVIVDTVMTSYIIAKTPVTDKYIDFARVLSRDQARLNVDEKAITGNPANLPIQVGDIVVRPTNLGSLVDLDLENIPAKS